MIYRPWYWRPSFISLFCYFVTAFSKWRSIFRLNFGKRSHCVARVPTCISFAHTGSSASGTFETTTKARKRGKEIEPWPAAQLTSRMYQLKAGWRQQPVWKTQGTKYGDRKPARGNSPLRVRGRNSINYELARDPLTMTTVRRRVRALHTVSFLSPSLCLQSVALRGSLLVIHKPQRELSVRPELLEALNHRRWPPDPAPRPFHCPRVRQRRMEL